MSIENFGEIQTKKESSKEWLMQQINLPRPKWDNNFLQLIDNKVRENIVIEKEAENWTPETSREKFFERYLKGLGLSIDDMREKAILDLGCGDGEFVKTILQRNITEKVYGLDIKLPKKEKKYSSHFIKADFEAPLPMKDFDYIISVGAVSNRVWGGENEEAEKVIKNALESLNNNGEIRIFPIQEPPPESDLPGLEASHKKWFEILELLKRENGIEWRLEPIDIAVSGKNNDVWLEKVLIIKISK